MLQNLYLIAYDFNQKVTYQQAAKIQAIYWLIASEFFSLTEAKLNDTVCLILSVDMKNKNMISWVTIITLHLGKGEKIA